MVKITLSVFEGSAVNFSFDGKYLLQNVFIISVRTTVVDLSDISTQDKVSLVSTQ